MHNESLPPNAQFLPVAKSALWGSSASAWCLLLLSLLGTAQVGCAGLPLKNPLRIAEDVHVKKEERRAVIVKEYEEKRSVALFHAAQSRLRQGDEAGCEQSLQQLLTLVPNHVQGRLLKAELLLMRYELLEAQREIEQALATAPEDPQVLHAMGLVQEALGNGNEAAEFFGRAAELDPENPLVTLDYETSMDPNYSSAGVTPETLILSDNHARAEHRSGNSHLSEKTQLKLEQATTNPRTAAMLRRAMLALASGDRNVTLAEVRQATQLEPTNFRIPRQIALEAIKTNHSVVACEILADAVERFPQSAELYRLYGLALYQEQRLPAAEQALRKATSLDNRDALAYFLLGQVFLRMGSSDQAQHFLAEAGRLDPSLSVTR